MNVCGFYEVTGQRTYRGHRPRSTFYARLGKYEERRAVQRGAIKLLARVTPSLQPGSYQLPKGWITNEGGDK